MSTIHQAYEIRIQGHLDPDRFQQFEHLTIKQLPGGETVLILPGADQAKLFGTLLRIRDIGVPLLSLIQVDLHDDDPKLTVGKE